MTGEPPFRTKLSVALHALAETKEQPYADLIRQDAQAFDDAAERAFILKEDDVDESARKVLGAWAKARSTLKIYGGTYA